jgi:hypothetical protein
MKPAKQEDWNTKPLPAKRASLSLDRTFTQAEMGRIKQGLVPAEMEDKWFVYFDSNALYFHRSWTGICIYVVQFTENKDSWHMTEADVNRDSEQHKATDDKHDSQMISYLVDVLLLHREAEFPSDEQSSEKRALQKWSQVGRAMLGQHPGDDGDDNGR